MHVLWRKCMHGEMAPFTVNLGFPDVLSGLWPKYMHVLWRKCMHGEMAPFTVNLGFPDVLSYLNVCMAWLRGYIHTVITNHI